MKKTIIILAAAVAVLIIILLAKRNLRLIARFPALATYDYDGKNEFVDGYMERQAQKEPLRVQKDTFLILFRDDASTSDISALLARYHLVPRSGLADVSLFVVERQTKSAAFDSTRLKVVLAALKKSKIVAAVAPNVPLERHSAQLLPAPSAQIKFPGSGCWKWVGGCDFNGTTPLVSMHFPEAWALNAAAINNKKALTTVGILDLGFASSHDDLHVESICDPKAADHGTYVAGVIGAGFGNTKGIDGAAAGLADVVACASPDIAEKVDENLGITMLIKGKVEEKRISFASNIGGLKKLLDRNLRVINISLGYNWNEVTNARPADSPQITEIVKAQGEMVRALLRTHPDTVLVTSAGNDCELERATHHGECTQPAMWTSPFNWAALGPPTAAGKPVDNVIVVEALDHSGKHPLPMSNIGGTIAAIGENILSTVPVTTAQPLGYKFDRGTSCAAPFVSATIALMLAENPKLTVSDIKRNLGITGPNHQPILDAFNAVRASNP